MNNDEVEETILVAADDFSLQPNWVKKDDWLSNKGICNWYGISYHHHKGTPLANQLHFDDNWGISILNLMEYNVQGTTLWELLIVLSDEIQVIDLSGNGIWWTLLLELGELDMIEGLYSLDENVLGGTCTDSNWPKWPRYKICIWPKTSLLN